MTDLSNLCNTVLDTFFATEEYRTYSELLERLKAEPVLFERVNEFREKNFILQQSDSEDLFDMLDALTNEYEDVINIELASEFIEAEAALCKLIQDFNRRVVDGLKFD